MQLVGQEWPLQGIDWLRAGQAPPLLISTMATVRERVLEPVLVVLQLAEQVLQVSQWETMQG
jgi:hypothetical protein